MTRPATDASIPIGDDIARAARLLSEGSLVAIPTETVYGLAADARNDAAVSRVFAVKGRPPQHPLIVHLADAAWLDDWATHIPPLARTLAHRFWPGPLTLVLRRHPAVSRLITGGQDTVAVRVPAHPLARELLARFGSAVVAPSANPFGSVSPTRAADVPAMFGAGSGIAYVLDGGDCSVGIESTIVDLSGARPAILRPGGISREELQGMIGAELAGPAGAAPRVPGQHPQHYAPLAKVLLCAADELRARVERELDAGRRVGALVPRGVALPAHERLVSVPVPDSFAAYARQLYRLLRQFDAQACDVIVAAAPPEQGLGSAIADRLRRAAAS